VRPVLISDNALISHNMLILRGIALLAWLVSACTQEVALDPVVAVPLTSRGALSLTLDGESVSLDYDSFPAQAALKHWQDVAGQGCVVQASLVAARPDGSCRLELLYRPWIGGGGLHLDEARLTIVSADLAVPRCAAWPEEPLAVPGDPIVYALHAGTSTLQIAHVKAQAGNLQAKIPGALLQRRPCRSRSPRGFSNQCCRIRQK